MKIIDEEIDLKKIAAGFENEEDIVDTQEDAPLIAGVIDERSEQLRTKQDFIENKKWKQIGANQNSSVVENKNSSTISSTSKNKFTSGKPISSNTHVISKKASSLKSGPPRKRHDSDSDASPPRKRHDSDSDASPPRKRHDSDSDASPPRQHQKSDSDASPPRKRHDSDSDSDASPPRKHHKSDSDASPPRRHEQSNPGSSPQMRKGSSSIRIKPDPDAPSKRTATLDGKKAGLQTGVALRQEMEELKKKQAEEFSKMDASLTGQNAATAIRASKKRQIEAKIDEEKEKQEKLAKLNAAYSKWNKGLKQGQDQSTKLAQDLYEMSKPMARFAGDEDLDEYQRNQVNSILWFLIGYC